ncbi:MAG: TetR/AcrR family transcriptional regulator [Myxococcales bacterium]|nr:TetR/AcrR family transcriptional regulator [Myxococcales bacterium]MDH3485390.1 TetR/AcrR family transcriptional regulator [Myxococcales bacterium]
MSTRKDYHHGDLRDALLLAAEKQLSEEGPAGLSLRKLGRDLGVTPGAPYRHFEDKDALLAALATIGFQRLRATMLKEQKECVTGEERLRSGGIGYLKFAWKHPELFRLMFGWMPAREAPELHESGDAAFALLVDMLRQCEREGLLRQTALDAGLLAWSAVHGAAFLMIDGGLKLCGTEPDPEIVGDRVHRSLWSGIARHPVSVETGKESPASAPA